MLKEKKRQNATKQNQTKSRKSEFPCNYVTVLWMDIDGNVLNCPVQFLTVTMNLTYC